MKMEDMVIISVDDHISEPPDCFEKVLDGKDLETAPALKVSEQGTNYWEYQGMKMPNVGLNAVVGRVPEEYGIEPCKYSELRPGHYDVDERVKDMNINGIASSLNFSTVLGMDGRVCFQAPDKKLALIHMKAWNDWYMQEWVKKYPGRFIPCGLLPTWDIDATIEEIKRIENMGYTSVSICENPVSLGLPPIHNEYWDPFWKAIVDHDLTIALHIGTGNPAPYASPESPIEAWITTMPMSIAWGASDWLHLKALQDYPSMRIALSEGGIGWIPYFKERADFSHERHKAWTHSGFEGTKPSEVFEKHFLNCFIDDAYGLKNIDEIGEDMIAYECDYPHSDSLWPEVPEFLWPTVQHLTDDQIDKVTHKNAMRFFKFDPFEHYSREDLCVGGLRKKAADQGVDTTLRSSGDVYATPLEAGEKPRRVLAGDIQKMMSKRDEAA